jgi:hypothetical protein
VGRPDYDIYFPNRFDLAALAPKTGLFVQIGCPVENLLHATGTEMRQLALPERPTVCGLFPASSLTLSVPLNDPLVSGWNVTVKLQLVNAATLLAQPLTE